MKTYKEQQEEKGLVFKPFQSPMYNYLKTVALNPNQKIDYYQISGTWITKEEDERRKKQQKLSSMLVTIFCSVIIVSFTIFSIFYL